MKKLLIFSFVVLLMQSCISARINSHKLVENTGQYEKLLLLITDAENVFLMDRNLFDNQYIAKINVDGSPNNSFEDLFDRLAKELAIDLGNKDLLEALV
jgi:hypothetical protein